SSTTPAASRSAPNCVVSTAPCLPPRPASRPSARPSPDHWPALTTTPCRCRPSTAERGTNQNRQLRAAGHQPLPQGGYAARPDVRLGLVLPASGVRPPG